MQTIERELPWVQPPPSVKDHLFLGGLKRLFPASVLTGVQATGSRQEAAIGCCASVQPPGRGCSLAGAIISAATAADIMEFSGS